ncbi:MAG: DUF169 domain-containing protein [bacterium]|nr:DUF169 domain-containing protein [bacterium]
MSRWDGAVKEVKDYLGLKYPLVAASYRDRPDPAAPVSKRFGCNAIGQAFRGKVVSINRDSTTCPGAVHWFGFENYRPGLVMFLTHGEKLFANEELAEKWFDSIPPPRPAPREYLVLKPLEKEEGEPELVLLLVNAHQAHRIHSIINFREGTLAIPHYYSAICQGAVANPISLGKPAITYPETVGKEFGGFGEDDIIFSLPFSYFLRLVKDLRDSDGGKDKFAHEIKGLLTSIR